MESVGIVSEDNNRIGYQNPCGDIGNQVSSRNCDRSRGLATFRTKYFKFDANSEEESVSFKNQDFNTLEIETLD